MKPLLICLHCAIPLTVLWFGGWAWYKAYQVWNWVLIPGLITYLFALLIAAVFAAMLIEESKGGD